MTRELDLETISKVWKIFDHYLLQHLWICNDKSWFTAQTQSENFAVLLEVLETQQVQYTILPRLQKVSEIWDRFGAGDVELLEISEATRSIPVEEQNYQEQN